MPGASVGGGETTSLKHFLRLLRDGAGPSVMMIENPCGTA